MGLMSFIISLKQTTPVTGGPILWGDEDVLMGSITITFSD
jgi:hypothetical protein